MKNYIIKNKSFIALLWGWIACGLGFELSGWVGNIMLIVGFILLILIKEPDDE